MYSKVSFVFQASFIRYSSKVQTSLDARRGKERREKREEQFEAIRAPALPTAAGIGLLSHIVNMANRKPDFESLKGGTYEQPPSPRLTREVAPNPLREEMPVQRGDRRYYDLNFPVISIHSQFSYSA